MAKDFRDFAGMAGKTAKAVGRQARQHGVLMSLSDKEIRSFLPQVVDPGERVDAYAGLRPHNDCPKVPRKRRVQDGFGGRRTVGKMVETTIGVADFVSGNWDPDDPRHGTGMHGGLDSLAGRLRIEFDPDTSGCEHVMVVTNARLLLMRVRTGVGRKVGPAIVPWWVRRDQVPACRPDGDGRGRLFLGFADSSWIRMWGAGEEEQIEAVRACFPHAPGPWHGEKQDKKR